MRSNDRRSLLPGTLTRAKNSFFGFPLVQKNINQGVGVNVVIIGQRNRRGNQNGPRERGCSSLQEQAVTLGGQAKQTAGKNRGADPCSRVAAQNQQNREQQGEQPAG